MISNHNPTNVLSHEVCRALLKKFLMENEKIISNTRTDNTDKPHRKGRVSVLSVPHRRSFRKFSLLNDFEEQLAIAE